MKLPAADVRLWFGRTLLCALGLVPAPAAEAFRFAWLSDTHIGSTTAADDLRAAVRDINARPDVAFVVLSGDVTEYGSRAQLTEAQAILAELKAPLRILPGNHDTKWSESGATDFPRLFGADRFAFEHGGIQFVGLHQGPVMRMGDGHFAPQDLRWLDETLSRTGGRRQPLVFITHYPLDPSIANWFEVLDRLKRCNTQAVLVGHGHGNRQLNFEGVPGVMGRSNLRAAKPAGGFTLVEVADGRMTFAEQLHGQSAQALWHSVALGERAFATSPTAPRPDSSVNRTFANVRCRWERSTGWTIAAAPAVWRDLAIVGDASGLVRAFALETGVDRWTFKTGGPVYATADVAGDRVVIASTDGSVYTLNAADGGLCWKLVTGRPIVACPCIADGVVYVGSSEGRFRALDLADGRLRWEFTGVRGFVETRPLVHDGKVVFGAWDGQLYALDAATGAKAWQWTGDRAGALLSPAACWPVAAAGKVFIVAPDRKMTAIDLRTGAQIWRTGEFAVRESLGLAVDGSRVFVRTMNDRFLAFATEPAEPRVEWNTDAQFGYDINSAQLVERDGTVFFGTKNGVVFALDAATGAVRWQHRLGPALVNTVAPLGANRVLVTDFDGRVALIEVAE